MSNDVDFARVGLSYLFNSDNPIDWGSSSSGARTPGVASTAFRESPLAVVVHAPVSGSAQCGYALPTRRRVSSMRFCILPIASVHIGMIALPSIQCALPREPPTILKIDERGAVLELGREGRFTPNQEVG